MERFPVGFITFASFQDMVSKKYRLNYKLPSTHLDAAEEKRIQDCPRS